MAIDNTTERFQSGDRNALVAAETSRNLFNEYAEAQTAVMPSFAFVGDAQSKNSAESALAVPADHFAGDLVAIMAMQNNKFASRNGAAILDALPSSSSKQVDEAVLSNIGEDKTDKLTANPHLVNNGRFSDPSYRRRSV